MASINMRTVARANIEAVKARHSISSYTFKYSLSNLRAQHGTEEFPRIPNIREGKVTPKDWKILRELYFC